MNFVAGRFVRGAFAAVSLFSAPSAFAAETSVAVAANFTEAANEIAKLFTEKTGHTALLSFGASGALFTQITQAAPFEVFLSADQERPRLAVEAGLAAADSRFTYAIGRIVLYSRDPALVTGEETLKTATFLHLAIANPATAPYGAAAVEAMQKLGVYDAIAARIVQGENITQTFQFVETGNAELGFVAMSQLVASEGGSQWVPPQELYAPIRQDAVLLNTGAGKEAAEAFVAFLKGPEAAEVIARFGYGTE